MVHDLPFRTKEEKAIVLQNAKRGDPIAQDFLMSTYSLYVWTEQEIDALNILLDAGIHNEITEPFFVLLKKREEATNAGRKKGFLLFGQVG